jgi:hypothetical protein
VLRIRRSGSAGLDTHPGARIRRRIGVKCSAVWNASGRVRRRRHLSGGGDSTSGFDDVQVLAGREDGKQVSANYVNARVAGFLRRARPGDTFAHPAEWARRACQGSRLPRT